VISSVILRFLSHFVRHRGGGGRGGGRKGARCWRTWRSPVGRRGRRRQGHSRERRHEGEVGAHTCGGAARGIAGSGARWGGGVGRKIQGHDVGQCEVGRRGVGMHGIRSCGVDRAARGWTGGVGGAGVLTESVCWARRVRSIGWTGGSR
jgi:hypothetical protein